MNKKIPLVILALCTVFIAVAQEVKLWTEADRKYLIDNLTRSRDELIKETNGLTKEQWNFKESSERWSINQIVEHIGIWELLMTHDVSRGLGAGAHPEFAGEAKPDSTFYNFIMEDKQHISTDYTKPFTYTLPSGINELKNNVAWVTKMRNESIGFVTSTQDDLRVFFIKGAGSSSIHTRYITIFGHMDRHLRQLKKVKQHPNYPKKKIKGGL